MTLPLDRIVDISIEGLFILCFDRTRHQFEISPVMSVSPIPTHTLTVTVKTVDRSGTLLKSPTSYSQAQLANGLNISINTATHSAGFYGNEYIDPSNSGAVTDFNEFGWIIHFSRIHSGPVVNRQLLRSPIIIKDGSAYSRATNETVSYRLHRQGSADIILGRRSIEMGHYIQLADRQSLIVQPIGGAAAPPYPYDPNVRYKI